jgi:branched-chain amino acid transport system substrate-binding protein
MVAMKKKIILYVGAILLPLVLIASGYPAQGSEVVVDKWHIPFLIPLSGPLAGRMEQQKWIVDEVAADINKAGGIRGKPVVIEYYDTALDPTKAVAQMGKAIDTKCLCIIGPVVEHECKAAMSLAAREGMFCYSATGTENVAKTFAPWMIQAVTPEMYLAQEKDIKSMVALIQPMYPLMVTIWKGIAENMEKAGVKTYKFIEVPDGLLDYGPLVVRALNTGANSVYIAVIEGIAAKMVKELYNRDFDMTNILCGTEAVSTKTFLEETAGSNEGVYSTNSPDYEPTPMFAELNSRYKATHGGIGLHSMAYAHGDMLLMIKKHFEQLKITGDPARLKEERIKIKDIAFNQSRFEGIQATYRIVDGIAYDMPVYLFQVQNGKFVLVDKR